MARIASFPSRATVKSWAEQATRFALTHARYESKRTQNGIEYQITVDFTLNAVFIDWTDQEHGKKATSHVILKSWGGKGRDWQPDEEESAHIVPAAEVVEAMEAPEGWRVAETSNEYQRTVTVDDAAYAATQLAAYMTTVQDLSNRYGTTSPNVIRDAIDYHMETLAIWRKTSMLVNQQ
jgi:hypothetical protein